MSRVSPEVIAKVMALDPEKRRTVPLRLAVAARVAFPDGTMGASGLRKERDKGRLVTEMIAGKEYTTLAEIERMREQCRMQPKEPVSFGVRIGGVQASKEGISPQDAARIRLKKLKDSFSPKR